MALYIDGFPPVIDQSTRLLVLGSMPGVASLDAHQYYAHPRNVFWQQMATIFEFDPNDTYEQRLRHLLVHHLGLWDVVGRCIRPGSLDSRIQHDSVELNDFMQLFDTRPALSGIIFNGQKAAQLFKPMARKLARNRVEYRSIVLPSTSPAYAAMPVATKLTRWKSAVQEMLC